MLALLGDSSSMRCIKVKSICLLFQSAIYESMLNVDNRFKHNFYKENYYLSRMKLYILLLLTAMVSLAFSCDSYTELDYSTCTIYANLSSQDGTCGGFDFQYCTWVECIRYVSTGRTSYCAEYRGYNSSSWDICTYKCCDSQVSYPQTAYSVQQCQNYLHQLYTSSIIIVIAISASIIGVILVCSLTCCCCFPSQCKEFLQLCCCQSFGSMCDSVVETFTCLFSHICACLCCQCLRNDDQNPPEPNQAPGQETNFNIAKKPLEEQMSTMQLTWKQDVQKQLNFADVCSVCLDGHPSLQLECGHIYHRECILACMRRKQECILCRSTHFNLVRVYCQQCFSSFYQTTLLQHSLFLGKNRQLCEPCQSPTFDI